MLRMPLGQTMPLARFVPRSVVFPIQRGRLRRIVRVGQWFLLHLLQFPPQYFVLVLQVFDHRLQFHHGFDQFFPGQFPYDFFAHLDPILPDCFSHCYPV
jgi:hypothetical protein